MSAAARPGSPPAGGRAVCSVVVDLADRRCNLDSGRRVFILQLDRRSITVAGSLEFCCWSPVSKNS